jgi:hypothetical protein
MTSLVLGDFNTRVLNTKCECTFYIGSCWLGSVKVKLGVIYRIGLPKFHPGSNAVVVHEFARVFQDWWWVLLGHICHHLECSPGGPNAIDHITLTGACHGFTRAKDNKHITSSTVASSIFQCPMIILFWRFHIRRLEYPRTLSKILCFFLHKINLLLGKFCFLENVKHFWK